MAEPVTAVTHDVMTFPDNQLAIQMFGAYDQYVDLIEQRLAVTLHPRGNSLVMTGQAGQLSDARQLLQEIYRGLEQGVVVNRSRIEALLQMVTEEEPLPSQLDIELRTPCRVIAARNVRQASYIRLMQRFDLTFCIGPAGTGKTYLAAAVAVAGLIEGRWRRIILTRPAIEAGERLGFLPGDLQAKVDPYLRPLHDALHDMLGAERVERMLQQRVLEIAPLAYMRGRTLEQAFIILDEGQNATVAQMKMFLTRLGAEARMVVCGDVTQVDLPAAAPSGLSHALQLLRNVEGIGFATFTDRDVVRHRLVRRIVQAYEQAMK
ncbi:MAG: PhoH family protein [Magnetococcales bacterium]|nr:PhoH family protein [Magnetococcales bacterium]